MLSVGPLSQGGSPGTLKGNPCNLCTGPLLSPHLLSRGPAHPMVASRRTGGQVKGRTNRSPSLHKQPLPGWPTPGPGSRVPTHAVLLPRSPSFCRQATQGLGIPALGLEVVFARMELGSAKKKYPG